MLGMANIVYRYEKQNTYKIKMRENILAGKVINKKKPFLRKSFYKVLTLISNKLNYSQHNINFNCGLDETRTRDPLRDRQVF